MVSARVVLAEVRSFGADVALDEQGRLHLRGCSRVPSALVAVVREHLEDLRALLREHEAIPTASAAVIAAAALLREGRWACEPGPCGFFTGVPAGACLRCGVEWVEHLRLDGAGNA